MRFATTSRAAALVETLEGRTLLSAAPVGLRHAAKAPHPAAHAATHAAAHKPVAQKPAAQKPAGHKGNGGGIDPIFMQIQGVTGPVALKGYVGDIELNSFQWGVGVGVSSPTGGSSSRETSAPSVSEVTVTKVLDKTSTKLLNDILTGTAIPEVDILFVVLNKTNPTGVTYAEYDLSNVIISGYSLSSSGDRPVESLSLNFTKVQYKSIAQNADGTTSVDKVGYDLGLAKVV